MSKSRKIHEVKGETQYQPQISSGVYLNKTSIVLFCKAGTKSFSMYCWVTQCYSIPLQYRVGFIMFIHSVKLLHFVHAPSCMCSWYGIRPCVLWFCFAMHHINHDPFFALVPSTILVNTSCYFLCLILHHTWSCPWHPTFKYGLPISIPLWNIATPLQDLTILHESCNGVKDTLETTW